MATLNGIAPPLAVYIEEIHAIQPGKQMAATAVISSTPARSFLANVLFVSRELAVALAAGHIHAPVGQVRQVLEMVRVAGQFDSVSPKTLGKLRNMAEQL